MIKSPVRHNETEIASYSIDPAKTEYVTPNYRRDWYKRPFDLAVVIAAHLLLFPVMLALWTLIPLSIWLEDRGPVFYTQRRVGKNGKVFRLYKFRSMIVDAESISGPVWASASDSRITRVGRFIRARALDELPQIINVIKGELSLVGPRPERPELVDQFVDDLPQFLKRLQVRPGLTGVAQIFGRYATRPRDKLRYDVLYINRVSPWLDFKLLFVSAYVTIMGRWQHQDKRIRGIKNQSAPSTQESDRRAVESR